MASKARELANLGNAYSDGALSNRNLIINGAMQVAQRGTSFSGLTNGTSVTYTVDRFAWVESGSTTATFVVTQETDAPDGFGNSLKISPSTSGGGHNVIEMYQPIESQNCLPLAFGTSNAKSFTLSFWVKSNQTGTGAVCFYNLDSLRIRAENYTINAADTWEYKTITVSGDTSGSTFANDNGAGLTVRFPIAASASYSDKPTGEWATYDDGYRGAGMTIDLTTSTSDYLQITGVQLEVGDTATPFEHRSYGQELALCQRYYQIWNKDGVGAAFANPLIGVYNNSSNPRFSWTPSVDLRSAPSVTINGALSDYDLEPFDRTPSSLVVQNSFREGVDFNAGDSTGGTQGHACWVVAQNGNAFIEFDAEL